MRDRDCHDAELLEANLAFYDPLWKQSRLASPERFSTWPLVHSLLTPSQSRLEVGPGLRPRLPLEGTYFVDASLPAVTKLREHGARAQIGLASRLPFGDGEFDLVAAFDIVEHVDDDEAVLSELARVASPTSTLLISAPLHPARWTKFDDLVGHRRRYEPEQLLSKLARHGLSVAGTAAYGMQPRSSLLLDLGVWGLTHRREHAIWWYDHVLLRLGAMFQKKLELATGMMDVTEVDEVLLECRKADGASGACTWPHVTRASARVFTNGHDGVLPNLKALAARRHMGNVSALLAEIASPALSNRASLPA